MRISVCMGIYNGEKYIVQQLESLRRQTRKPDEVILCDDGSTDKTRSIVGKYLENHRELSSWKFICNAENRGYPGNFYYAMGQCTGDVVFLADQDDIWAEDKIARMSGLMEKQTEIKVLACTYGLIDDQENAIHTVMSPTAGKTDGNFHRMSIGYVFYKYEWPGMVLAYRNRWYQERMQENTESDETVDKCWNIPHDFLLCAWAAEEDGFYQLEEVLAYHRRHEHNTALEEHRIGKLLNKVRKLKEIEGYSTILAEFAEKKVLRTEKGRKTLEEKRISMQDRYEALQSGKIRYVLKNAWNHRKQVRAATLICDVLIVWQRAESRESEC